MEDRYTTSKEGTSDREVTDSEHKISNVILSEQSI